MHSWIHCSTVQHVQTLQNMEEMNVFIVVCNPGQQLNSSGTGCEVCPVNSWKSTYSLDPCNPCAVDSITNGSVAQVSDTCGNMNVNLV